MLSVSLSTTTPAPPNNSSLFSMAINLDLHESITALVFLIVCRRGVVKLAMGFRWAASEAVQADIELGSISAGDNNGDGDYEGA